MIYPYRCDGCQFEFDVVKSVSEFDREESCEKCQGHATRQFNARVHFIGTKVQHAEYNPGLGCVVKNKRHREELCKRKGLTEVGNESPDRIYTENEKQRESNREASWEKVLKETI